MVNLSLNGSNERLIDESVSPVLQPRRVQVVALQPATLQHEHKSFRQLLLLGGSEMLQEWRERDSSGAKRNAFQCGSTIDPIHVVLFPVQK